MPLCTSPYALLILCPVLNLLMHSCIGEQSTAQCYPPTTLVPTLGVGQGQRQAGGAERGAPGWGGAGLRKGSQTWRPTEPLRISRWRSRWR